MSYKIPDTLSKDYLDTEIVLSSRKGVAIKPLPVKVIFGFVGGILGAWWMINSKFMSPAPLWDKALFILVLGAMLSMLLWPDRTGKSRYVLLPALIEYMQKQNREVYVRRNLPVNNFVHISNIKQIYPEKGLIMFADGGYGYAYNVVGNASVLLFEEDKNAILDRVDNFYRKMKTDYELIYLTAKEPQHIDVQLYNMRRRFKKLDIKTKDLTAVANMEYRILHDEVGEQFRSIHQYLIIRANNPEALTLGKNMLMAECNSSRFMFKEADALFDDDLIKMLGGIFQGKESV